MGTPVPNTETASSWTDEKHVHFLNAMEASFVLSMFENDKGDGRRRISHRLRLDRPLPDASESTSDLKSHPTTRKRAPSDLMPARGRIDGRRMMRRLTPPYDSSQDQVVPQLEKDNNEGSDWRDKRGKGVMTDR
ncbi:hypothetical protein L6164_008331 [Bauhinia variegata]|uniref:Uncharacterized protein n=1 Tax=Bauhinia variegata TaxID=167791 RepID=A0ACB9PHJ1_BAUVA|nr:hypothetical protein L6164_008331 [Bauhinia variegata]